VKFDSIVTAVAWNPMHALLSVAAEEAVFFLDPGLETPLPVPTVEEVEAKKEGAEGGKAADGENAEGKAEEPPPITVATLLAPEGMEVPEEAENDGAKARAVRWKPVTEDMPLYASGCRIMISTDCDVQQLTWHPKGNYCAAVSPKAKAPSNQCIIHALKQRKSMRPFTKVKGGQIQSCAFHPTKPHFFVATKTSVRVYDLQKQIPLKQLVSGAKWIASVTLHPGGDNIVAGSYDRRMVWFDLDFGSKPYKTLQYHDRAVRRVAFHPGNYPLLAAASDDGTVSILHAKVYSDLMKSPMIVPVKRLRDHFVCQGLGVLDCTWHPQQPWLFTAGADHRVYLWA